MNPLQKLATANVVLVLYFIMPNLTSLALALLLLTLYLCPQNQNKSQCQSCKCSLNDLFNQYLELSYTKKLLVVVGAGLIAQLTYWWANWLVVLLLVEMVAGWELLAQLGIIELAQTQVQSAQVSLNKLMAMIPRYKGE